VTSTSQETTQPGTSPDAHIAELARLIGVALSSTATAAGADVVCVDRKTLQDIQMHINALPKK
jgi:hypothetical protein